MDSYDPNVTGVAIWLRVIWWWQPLFYFCAPIVEADGVKHVMSWGSRFLALPPGDHAISVYFNYLGQKECGKATLSAVVLPNEITRMRYKPPFSVLQKGSLRIT